MILEMSEAFMKELNIVVVRKDPEPYCRLRQSWIPKL